MDSSSTSQATPAFANSSVDISLVAENSIPLYVPPPVTSNDEFVTDLLTCSPLSPHTPHAALKNHGQGLSSKVALLLTKKVAQMAIDKAHNTELRLLRLTAYDGSREPYS